MDIGEYLGSLLRQQGLTSHEMPLSALRDGPCYPGSVICVDSHHQQFTPAPVVIKVGLTPRFGDDQIRPGKSPLGEFNSTIPCPYHKCGPWPRRGKGWTKPLEPGHDV